MSKFQLVLLQGLVHLGKGTLTLNPFHSDRQLMSPVAVAGLMSVLVAMLDVKTTILGKSHYLLYGLATAMQPRMLVTFDTELRPLPVSVRVGNAVDVVGQVKANPLLEFSTLKANVKTLLLFRLASQRPSQGSKPTQLQCC